MALAKCMTDSFVPIPDLPDLDSDVGSQEHDEKAPEVAAIDLPVKWWMLWDERAAIMEYHGGLPRKDAETLAYKEILGLMAKEGAGGSEHRRFMRN